MPRPIGFGRGDLHSAATAWRRSGQDRKRPEAHQAEGEEYCLLSELADRQSQQPRRQSLYLMVFSRAGAAAPSERAGGDVRSIDVVSLLRRAVLARSRRSIVRTESR